MEGVEYSVRDSSRVHRVITSRLDGWCFGAVGEKRRKGKGEKRGRCPGAPRILSPLAGEAAGQGLGEHSSHQSSFLPFFASAKLPLPRDPLPGTYLFLLRIQWKTSLMCVERVMHAHGGPVPWTVYLHGKVLGRQGGWKLAPPAGGCAGPHHGCLSKSRVVISPRFMCHPVPSGRGPLTDAARGQIPAYRFWLVPSDTHRQSASSWKLP